VRLALDRDLQLLPVRPDAVVESGAFPVATTPASEAGGDLSLQRFTALGILAHGSTQAIRRTYARRSPAVKGAGARLPAKWAYFRLRR